MGMGRVSMSVPGPCEHNTALVHACRVWNALGLKPITASRDVTPAPHHHRYVVSWRAPRYGSLFIRVSCSWRLITVGRPSHTSRIICSGWFCGGVGGVDGLSRKYSVLHLSVRRALCFKRFRHIAVVSNLIFVNVKEMTRSMCFLILKIIFYTTEWTTDNEFICAVEIY